MQQRSLQIQFEEEQDRIASAREDFEIDAAATPEIQDEETPIKETNLNEEIVIVKRGRPAKKRTEKELSKEWEDEEIEILINFWSQCDPLFNCKIPSYHNRDERSKALEFIRGKLSESSIIVTSKQISDKLTSLRTYFWAEKRKMESSKKSGAGRNELYFSKWRFYEPLMFLSDSFTPRQTESSYSAQENSYPSQETTPNSARAKRGRPSPMEEVIPIMKAALNKMDESSVNKMPPPRESSNTEDQLFADLICKMMTDIPESFEKATLKLSIQNQIIHLKFVARDQHPPPSPLVSHQSVSPPSPMMQYRAGFQGSDIFQNQHRYPRQEII